MKTALRILASLFFLVGVANAGNVVPSGNIITDTSCSGDISADCSTVSGASGNAFTSAAFGATLNLSTLASAVKGTSIASTLGVGSIPAHLSVFGTCNAAAEGRSATEDNSTVACLVGATATSAGTTHCQIYCNGTNWLQTGL